VTWAKFGDQYSDDIAKAGLSDAAYRTHTEAIGWLYRVEDTGLRIPKTIVRRFAGSDGYETAIRELLLAGFWREDGREYVVEHHAEVIRQSLAAQLLKRETERNRLRRKRRAPGPESPDVSANVGTNADANVRPTQPTIHTSDRGSDDGWGVGTIGSEVNDGRLTA